MLHLPVVFLLLMFSVVLKRLPIYLHFIQCSSPFLFIQYCSVFPLLMCRLYFCIFAVILSSSALLFCKLFAAQLMSFAYY